MGDETLATKTLAAINKVEQLEALANQVQVFCTNMPATPHGRWNASSLKANSLAILTCDKDYETKACDKMKCDANGAWIFYDCGENSSTCSLVKGPNIPVKPSYGEGESDPKNNVPSNKTDKGKPMHKGEGEATKNSIRDSS
jgi:hypothetical protein